MKVIDRPARAREAVAAMDVVAGISDDELDAVLEDVEWVAIPGGEALFREGEESDSFYVIVRGRLRTLLTDESGESVVVRELSRATRSASSASSPARLARQRWSRSATPSWPVCRARRSSASSSARRASRSPSRGSSRTG